MTKKISTVFLGSASNMNQMEQAFVVQEMADNGIGLYGHTNGIFSLVVNNQMSQFMSSFNSSLMSSGVYEWGFSSGYAEGSVTVKNTGNTDQIINIGEIFKGSNGESYTIQSYAGQPGYLPGDSGPNKNGYVSTSTGGYYLLKPGASSTLYLEDTKSGSQGNMDSNNINSFMGAASNISITSSSAFIEGEALSDVLSFTKADNVQDSPAYYLTRKYGYSATQTNVNLGQDMIYSQNDLASWKAYVDSARQNAGVMSVAPILSFNSLDIDYSQDFATSAYWAPYREMASYGGGISFDAPPSFMMYFTTGWFPIYGKAANTYINFIESEIKWANSQGLRTSFIVSPQDYDSQYAGGFLQATKNMVERLQKDGALPSQFIVENYGNTSNFFSTDQNSLNNVAEWIAQNVTTTPTNSESNQQNIGESVGNKAATMIMTGISPSISVGYSSTSSLYSSPALYSNNPNEIITVTLNINKDGLDFVSNEGTITNNGETLNYSGTEAQITALLQNLKISNYVSDNSKGGTAQLSLVFHNSTSNISGTTNINYVSNPDTNKTIFSGQNETMNINTTNSSILGQNGSLNMTGNTNLILTGIFDSFNISNTGTNTMYTGLTGNGIISGGQGTPGVTLENDNSQLNVSNSNISVYGYGGTFIKTGSGDTILYGTVNHMYIYSGNNNLISTALNGDGYIGNSIGTMGVTLTGNSSNLTVDSSYAYITAGDGSVTFNNGASGNITGATTKSGGLFVNANGGQVNYQADNATNTTFFVKNGELNAKYDKGYTSSVVDMTKNVDVDISGFTAENGNIIATNLNSLNDLSITYQNGGALISEQGNAGHIFISNVNEGMLNLYSKMGDVDFSQKYGSNSILIATNQHDTMIYNTNS